MIVDCGDCKVRDIACADCVVTVLLGAPGRAGRGGTEAVSKLSKMAFDQEELGAMDVLADSGLVPRLRLVVDANDRVVGESLSTRDTVANRHAM
ncbi:MULTISPECIES: hypothetical protein [Nocardiaceae]|jgi:hypothetical protein|uniref:hypothetical protein n=1 Tax=Nocardiaceae TaxID=85025 RepID=UPI001E6491E2|nr:MULTISPECIES: hypothetical protein [Rhodococcus]MCC8927783.1 hypothetical protein [Rhodococcus sp. I2R]MCZ4275592.1 hypothetical protein [Rhodococcus yunnanensis]